ncbi:Differentiation-associated protein 1, putative isoform [Thalictrum thalictroides]|uniref:Differentiation-associated protein 1, putative isoform n=1 Tax=Thalictrum thalictroides TaxID=46969 RepID=A0A7J6WLC9_THATH|nr:Differentiation-associated protein 1, putative isoform [Thalictrum thalictroides]
MPASNFSLCLFLIPERVLQAKVRYTSRRYPEVSEFKTKYIAASSGPWFVSRKTKKDQKFGLCTLAADSNQVVTNPMGKDSGVPEKILTDDQLLAAKSERSAQTGDASKGVVVPSDVKLDPVPSPKSLKRSSLTAREKLRAARVLSRYTESKPSKPEFGSKVLDALRESEKGKKRSRLPEAPTNLLDDSKRGMPKQGLTFEFPGGFDLFLIVLSFVLITTTMVATTYIVWKLGAIHFNDN